MPSVRSMIEKRLERVEAAVDELRGQLDEGEFDTLIQTADKVGSEADGLATKLQQVSDQLVDEDEDEDEDDREQQEGDEEKPQGSRRSKAK